MSVLTAGLRCTHTTLLKLKSPVHASAPMIITAKVDTQVIYTIIFSSLLSFVKYFL